MDLVEHMLQTRRRVLDKVDLVEMTVLVLLILHQLEAIMVLVLVLLEVVNHKMFLLVIMGEEEQ